MIGVRATLGPLGELQTRLDKEQTGDNDKDDDNEDDSDGGDYGESPVVMMVIMVMMVVMTRWERERARDTT